MTFCWRPRCSSTQRSPSAAFTMPPTPASLQKSQFAHIENAQADKLVQITREDTHVFCHTDAVSQCPNPYNFNKNNYDLDNNQPPIWFPPNVPTEPFSTFHEEILQANFKSESLRNADMSPHPASSRTTPPSSHLKRYSFCNSMCICVANPCLFVLHHYLMFTIMHCRILLRSVCLCMCIFVCMC